MKTFEFKHNPPRAAVFLSGTGSNAEALLADRERSAGEYPCEFAVLVTDRPESCRAEYLGERYHVPVVSCSIREFYARHGEDAIALTTPKRRELREAWTDELRRQLKAFDIDFGILAGFVPLCNIAGDFPCLNVHPGDLTVEDEAGRRILAGLHFRPVETAILSGHSALRSSVIIATPFSGSGKEDMDGGPVLGISEAVALDLEGVPLEELRLIDSRREAGGKCSDLLREIACKNVERLKIYGDHIVLPAAVRDFASGHFALDGDTLLYRRDEKSAFEAVRTVEYFRDGGRRVPVLKN